jgi:hypothetical protein
VADFSKRVSSIPIRFETSGSKSETTILADEALLTYCLLACINNLPATPPHLILKLDPGDSCIHLHFQLGPQSDASCIGWEEDDQFLKEFNQRLKPMHARLKMHEHQLTCTLKTEPAALRS